jgi:hypothetical protein
MSLKLPNALDLADFWNRNAERWTSVTGTALSKRLGVSGYYVPVWPAQIIERPEIFRQVAPIHNRAEASCPPTNWSAPSFSRSFVSACAAPTIR